MNEKRPENNQDGQSNFRAALQELLGNKNKEEGVNIPVIETPVERKELPREQPKEQPTPEISYKKPTPVQTSSNYNGGTIISEDVVIEGSITSKTDICLNCIVNGNVTSESRVMIAGTVEGDVTGSSIMLKNARIKGNIISQNEVNLDQGSVLIGDIRCQRLDSNGKIEGSVDVGTSVILRSDSEINGNLSAQALSVQEGSLINGAINIKREKKVTPVEFKKLDTLASITPNTSLLDEEE